MSRDCKCSASLPRGAMVWSTVCECDSAHFLVCGRQRKICNMFKPAIVILVLITVNLEIFARILFSRNFTDAKF